MSDEIAPLSEFSLGRN
uniref:Uncharacterized protein n=1 Tax=Anguilla anguilla TaxID=7936 RepID=A0A0E9VS93_ANGAN